jgi:hypothetical protein
MYVAFQNQSSIQHAASCGECVVLGIDAVPATEESNPFFLVGIALQYFTAKDIPFFLLLAFEILRGFL